MPWEGIAVTTEPPMDPGTGANIFAELDDVDLLKLAFDGDAAARAEVLRREAERE
jgi:hypothetical protein